MCSQTKLHSLVWAKHYRLTYSGSFSGRSSYFCNILYLKGCQHRKLLFFLEWWTGFLCTRSSFLSFCFWLLLPQSKWTGEEFHSGLQYSRVCWHLNVCKYVNMWAVLHYGKNMWCVKKSIFVHFGQCQTSWESAVNIKQTNSLSIPDLLLTAAPFWKCLTCY